MSSIYERIKQRRIELGLTVEELANKMGYKDKSSISKIENGKADIPTSKVVAFAKALETTTAYLLGVDTPVSSIPPGFEPLPKMVKRPLVGTIACGEPITAEENIEDYVDVPEDAQCDFCLRCKGDSMIDAGISAGDLLVLRQQDYADEGEIVVALVGENATLKRFYKKGRKIILHPENKSMNDIIVDDCQIQGVLVSCIKMY